MGELLLLTTIIALVVLTIRRGKRVVLDDPLVIQSPGQYHITLAPKLGRVQAFIESIAKLFAESHQPQGDIPTQYFEVRDPEIAQGSNCYLLAATSRGGTLYFQAISPRDAVSHCKTLREFSEAVLVQLPLSEPLDGAGVKSLHDAVETAANQRKIAVKELQQTD